MPTAPSIVQDNSGGTGSASSSWSITPALSAGATAGNLIIVFISSDATFSTTYSGWTLIQSVVGAEQSSAFYRIAAGSETSFTGPTVASQTVWWIGEIATVAAAIWDTTNPNWTTTTNVSSYASPSTGTTTIAETLIIAMFGLSRSITPMATVSSYNNSFAAVAHGSVATSRAQTATNVSLGVGSRTPNAIAAYTTTATFSDVTIAPSAGIVALRGAETAIPKTLADSGVGADAITGQLITVSGPNYGSSTASITGIDPTDWVNPGNVYADDTSYATWSP